MNTNYTSIEQSEELVRLGLDPESTDMKWFEGEAFTGRFNKEIAECHKAGGIKQFEPCWNLGCLLGLMSEKIYSKEKPHVNGYILKITKYRPTYDGEDLGITYSIGYNVNAYNQTSYIFYVCYDTLLEGAFKLMCWLFHNKYV